MMAHLQDIGARQYQGTVPIPLANLIPVSFGSLEFVAVLYVGFSFFDCPPDTIFNYKGLSLLAY